MGLKLMCAGCSKDERQLAETTVREALGTRVDDGSWIVSLVKVTDQWSVTLDAPYRGVRALTVVAREGRLSESIAEALEPPRAPLPPQTTPSESRSWAECEKCQKAFVVVYEASAEECEESAPVACPHCWHVNHALVGERAAETREYRAEKA